jgi:cyanophycin synthetase
MHGLTDPTAVLRLDVQGVADAAALKRLAARARAHFALTDGVPADDLLGALVHGGQGAAPVETLAARWLAALAVAFQRAARDAVGPARVLSSRSGRWVLALPYHRPEVLQSGWGLIQKHFVSWQAAADLPRDAASQLATARGQWLERMQKGGLAPNTMRFALAARERGHPVSPMGHGYIQIGWGARQQRMESSFTGNTGVLATRIARVKPLTGALLARAGLPVPKSIGVSNWAGALKAAQALGWPVVVKPASLDQGAGVVPDIHDEALLREAFQRATSLSRGQVLIEKHVHGDDHRFLVVGGRLLMATRRIPGGVTGDGRRTVSGLLTALNADPRRGNHQRSLLRAIPLDDEANTRLKEQGLTADSVVEAGRFVALRRTANISTGGTAVDVTAQVHPDNRWLAEQATRIVGLDIAGVDLLCPDITRSWREVGGAICEINAQPGFRPHWLGDPLRDVNAEIVDWLCRDGTRIPTAAIGGTNGKSTTARMLHHIWLASGRRAGLSSTAGVWSGPDRMLEKAPVGAVGARMLLDDPSLEAAVIELPRRGLLRLGHPCDRYDVAALLNVQDDHIGADGIDSMDAMARLKAQILERAGDAVVLNADDPLCLSMRGRTRAPRLILVSRQGEGNPAVREHLAQGGEAVCRTEHEGSPWIVLAKGPRRTLVMALGEVPATMNGLLRFNEDNAMFAVALAHAQGLPLDTARAALATFRNSETDNPMRYNLFEGLPYALMVDFAHNPDGVREICEVARRWPAEGKRRLISLNVGNRHQHHVAQMAPALAEAFDHVVVSQDPYIVKTKSDWTGEDPAAMHLAAFSQALSDAGLDASAICAVGDRRDAVLTGLGLAQPGDLVILLADDDVIPTVRGVVHEHAVRA